MKQTKVAIIGGGVTGVSILSHLVHDERFTSEITVDVYDNAYTMGRGQAYQEDNEHLLINVPADEMSLGESHPDYGTWLKSENGKEVYTSRQQFGDYVKDQLEAIASIHEGVHLRYATVDGIEYDSSNGKFTLSIEEEEVLYDRVFLTIGQLRYGDPYNLKGSQGFLYDPYPLSRKLADIEDDNIGILGAGLSAIDCVRYLIIDKQVEKVSLFSRSGEMPSVRGERTEITLRHFTEEILRDRIRNDEIALTDIITLFKKELAHQNIDESLFFRRTGNTLQDLNYDLEHQETVGRLQYLIIKVNPIFSDVYQYLSRNDKKAFLEKYHHLIEENHSPMPAEVARLLVQWGDEGRLHIIDGTEHIKKENGFTILTKEGGAYQVDTLINATGPVKDVRRGDSKIIQSLMNHMIIAPSEFGGIMVDADRHVISPKVGTVQGMYALGALTIGSDYLSNSVQLLQKNAQKLINRFYEDMY